MTSPWAIPGVLSPNDLKAALKVMPKAGDRKRRRLRCVGFEYDGTSVLVSATNGRALIAVEISHKAPARRFTLPAKRITDMRRSMQPICIDPAEGLGGDGQAFTDAEAWPNVRSVVPEEPVPRGEWHGALMVPTDLANAAQVLTAWAGDTGAVEWMLRWYSEKSGALVARAPLKHRPDLTATALVHATRAE